jgi:hypothetical protein
MKKGNHEVDMRQRSPEEQEKKATTKDTKVTKARTYQFGEDDAVPFSKE